MPNRRKHRLTVPVLSLAALVLMTIPAAAQNTTYWSDAFGNRAQLLGGAVIASDESLSSVFYNPGRLGTGAGSEFVLTGNVFEVETNSVRQVEGPERELGTTRFRLLPSLFAGEIFGRWLGESRLAYSFFTRGDTKLRTDSQFGDEFSDIVEPTEFFSDSVRIDSSMSEYWGGFTWGRPLGERRGVGVSMFVGARNHRTRLQDLDQAVFTDGTLGIQYKATDVDFNNYRLLWKLGYSTVFEGWRLGVTLTTPPINLFGSGKLQFDDSLVVSRPDPANQITSTFQEGLSTEWKSPLSIGFGAARDLKEWSLHLSFEWFDSIGPYTVIDGEEFASQTTGEVFDPDIKYAADSVFNFAIGIERLSANEVRWYGSIRSDFGSGRAGDETNLAPAKYDLWHIGGGATFPVGSTDMTLGLTYGFGKSDPFTPLASEDELELVYSRIVIVLGVELPSGHDEGNDG